MAFAVAIFSEGFDKRGIFGGSPTHPILVHIVVECPQRSLENLRFRMTKETLDDVQLKNQSDRFLWLWKIHQVA